MHTIINSPAITETNHIAPATNGTQTNGKILGIQVSGNSAD